MLGESQYGVQGLGDRRGQYLDILPPSNLGALGTVPTTLVIPGPVNVVHGPVLAL